MSTDQFEDYVKGHSWENKDIFFTMNALVGEIGEVANVLKKEQAVVDFEKYRLRILAENRSSFQSQFIDESGDTLFYFVQMLNKRGVTLEEVMINQIVKMNSKAESVDKPYLK